MPIEELQWRMLLGQVDWHGVMSLNMGDEKTPLSRFAEEWVFYPLQLYYATEASGQWTDHHGGIK